MCFPLNFAVNWKLSWKKSQLEKTREVQKVHCRAAPLPRGRPSALSPAVPPRGPLGAGADASGWLQPLPLGTSLLG